MNTRLSTPLLGRNLFLKLNQLSDTYKEIKTNVANNVSNLTGNYKVRELKESEEHIVKDLIKSILLERGGVGMDSLYYDRELSALYDYYKSKGHSFNVLTHQKEIIGTIALGPAEIDDLDGNVCEVKKTYLKRQYRGKGHAKYMMQVALQKAIKLGYDQCIVDIEPRNKKIIAGCMQDLGFEPLDGAQNMSNENVRLIKNLIDE